MDKTDYYDKMDALVNDKQTYEVLKRDPTPALQLKLNSKLLDLKKTDARHSTLQQTEVPCTTTTERTTSTDYRNCTNLTYPCDPSLILWVPDLPTVQILDYRTETFDRRITTQTTID